MLFAIGRPFSPFYGLLMRLREWSYRSGLRRVTKVGVPVVSIGNLTMGGSGKTPVVRYVAGFFLEKGLRPAIISRGYGGKAAGRVNIVSDGTSVLMNARDGGDEPRLLAEALPGVMVLTGGKRKFPAMRAVEMGADVLILDDGFQHMGLARDLDLVLFNADFLAGNSRVFPGGDLREPVKALERSDGFVMSGINDHNRDRAGRFADLLRRHFPSHPVYMSEYRAAELICRGKEEKSDRRSLEYARGKKVFAFCGIAHPQRFRETLEAIGVEICGFRPFPDHHLYSAGDEDGLIREALSMGAELCLTTEKDLVKLSPRTDRSLPVCALRMDVHFGNDFKEVLLSRIDFTTSRGV
ncbi:MAG: tetraacyldisaccharide 4'-kinase [Desulfobulbaceae bacterium]